MSKIYIDGKHRLEPLGDVEQGFFIGVDKSNKTVFGVVGKADIDTQFDNCVTALHYFMKTYNEYTKGEFKNIIYNRAIQAFSLMIDDFYPEAKDLKVDNLTVEAVKKAQDDILRANITQR